MQRNLDLPKDLQDKYRSTVPEKILQLKKLIIALRKEITKPHLESLHFLIHKLAGNAGLYGYQNVSDICQKWDKTLLEKTEKFSSKDTSWLPELDLLLGKIEEGFHIEKKKEKIVVVDDDEDLLQVLIFCFESKGFETQGISTGKEALIYLLDEKTMKDVSLLVLDRMLPDMDGLDILTKFIDKHQNKIPVLILSVLSADKDIIEGLKKGAVDYMVKPFNHEILIEKALALIARASHV